MSKFEPQKRKNFPSHVEIPNTIPLPCCQYANSNYGDKEDDNDDDDNDDKYSVLLRCYGVDGQAVPCDSQDFSALISSDLHSLTA